MKVILRPRQTGRTEELIRLCAEAEERGEVSYIVCSNHTEAYRIAEVAKELKLMIGFPLTVHEFLDNQYAARNVNNLFIDNADQLLQAIAQVPIRAITVEQESEKCACVHCSETVRADDWTHPYCPQCYANPKCK
jgi:NAD-dependent SIR2 family protein deacetylase